ncbi:MAG: hypothetical protein QOG64_3281 [Acidimicrobiaceae bacterium]|nr:hypothetical protein [Acidimicrobiaceae bacterium]
MDPEDGLEDEEPVAGWLHPDDRLWRHPSEMAEPPWPTPVARPPLADESGRAARVWQVALLGGLIGALLTSGVMTISNGIGRRTTTVVRPIEQVVMPTANTGSPLVASPESRVVDIAQRLRPAIVQINVDGDKGHASGSGVVFRSDGNILTNDHVVDGASSIKVVMANGREAKAKLIGADPETDLAVVKIDGLPATQGQPAIAALGSAKNLKVGQQAVAIGSPLGLAGGPSVTVGVVSAVGREVETRNGGQALLDMIQTDAPIAPGSSGGALVNDNGEVIGITTAIAVTDSGAQGLGFAIPIDIARDTAEQLMATGKVVHVWIGVEGEDIDAETANQLSIDGGALVKNVRPKSPAADAGLSSQDIITHVDSRAITSMGGLIVALRARKPGDKVTVDYMHNGIEHTASLTLAVRPKDL